MKKIIAFMCALILCVSSIHFPVKVEASEVPVLNETFAKVNFASYGVSMGTYGGENKSTTFSKGPQSLDGVIFSDTIKFSGESFPRFIIGGNDSWVGIVFGVDQANRIAMYGSGLGTDNGYSNKKIFTSAGAGTEIFGKTVKLTVSFEYVTHDAEGEKNDLKVAVWFNDRCYGNEYYYFYNCTNLLGNVLTIQTEGEGLLTVAQPMVDESFTKVNFASYGIASGTYSGHKKTVTGKTGPNGLDGVVFSDTVKFTGETFPRFIIGGKDDFMGVVFGVYQPNELYMYGAGFKTSMLKFTSAGAGTEIIGKSVKLTASFEYVDNNGSGGENDLRIAVWFNDILYGDTYYYFNDCTDKLGNVMTVYIEDGGAVTVAPPTIDESFTKVNFASYGIASGTYSGHKKTVTGKTGPNGLDGVVFSDTVKFTGETFPRFIIGGKDDFMGVVFGVYQPNELYMYGGGFSTSMIKFTSAGAGTEIIGSNVKITASFEYVDHNGSGGENDLKIAVWFNDILYGDTYYYFNDCTDKLGNVMTVYIEDEGAVTVAPPTIDESFTKVNFASYGIASGTYSGNKKTVTGKTGPNGLDGVVFSDTVKFTGETFPRFIIGGKDDFMGVVFGVYQPNELYMYGSGFTTSMIKFTSAGAGTEIIGKNVKLTASFEYVDHNGNGGENDLKIAVWFNDRLYGDTYYYFNDCTDKLGNVMTVYIEGEGAITVAPPMVDDSFTKVNFATYGITSGTYSGSSKVVTGKTGPNGLDGVVFSDTVRFTGETFPRFIIGGKDDYMGVVFGVYQTNELYMYGAGFKTSMLKFTSAEAGTEIIGKNVKLTASFEYVDHNGSGGENDLKIAVWFNDISYGETYYYFDDCTDKLGNVMTIFIEGEGALAVAPPTLDDSFTEVKFGSYNIKDGVYESTGNSLFKSGTTTETTNLDGVVLTDKVKFTEETTSRFIIGGSQEWYGIVFGQLEKDKLSMTVAGTGYTQNKTYTFTSQDAGTTIIGETIDLSMSFEYVDHDNGGVKDDLKIAVWFNGKCYQDTYYYFDNCIQYFGNVMSVYATDNGALVVGDLGNPILDPTFTTIGFDTYGVRSGTYYYKNNQLSVEGQMEKENLDKVIFSDTIQFSQDGGCLNLGGKENGWQGLGLYVNEAGNLELKPNTGTPFKSLKFDSTIAGATLVGDRVRITMSFEYVDSDEDGEQDDVKFAIWFNDEAYRDTYFYLTDCATELGSYIGIYIEKEHATVTIESKLSAWAAEVVTFYDRIDATYIPGAAKTTEIYNLGNDKTLEHVEFVGKFKFSTTDNEICIGADETGFVIKLQTDSVLEIGYRNAEREYSSCGTFNATELDMNDFVGEWIKLQIGVNYIYTEDVMISVNVNNTVEKSFEITGVDKAILYRVVTLKGSEEAPLYHGSGIETEVFRKGQMGKGYLISGEGNITVNGEAAENGDLLTETGEYIIRCTKLGSYVKYVVIYNLGDVNGDDVFDVRDLVAAKKAEANIATSKQIGKYAADMDGNGSVKIEDMENIRQKLCEEATITSLSTVKTVDNDEMPIAGFFGPYRNVDAKGVSYDFVNDATYQKIKKLGINLICYTSVDYANTSQQQTVLDNLALSEKYDIGYYVTDSGITEDYTDAQLATRLSKYAGFQSFKGIFVVDEPFTQDYASVDSQGNSTYEKKKLEDYQGNLSLLNSYSNLTGYVNLNPRNQALNRFLDGLGDLDTAYKNYVQACVDTGIKEISWDYYVWDQYISSGTSTSDYFKNLSVIRAKAIENKLPFWSFIQAGSNWNDSKEDKKPTDNTHPTEAELLWNVNTSLAYGAKGIQYFTLIQPSYFAYTEGSTYDYERNGLIGANGEPTKWYGYAQKANKQISLIDEYLMRAETKAILATVNGNAKRDTGLSADEYEGIQISATNGAIAGIFDYCGKTAIYVVNYQTADSSADAITVNFGSTRNYKVIATSEQLVSGSVEAESNSCTVELVGGGAALILLQ